MTKVPLLLLALAIGSYCFNFVPDTASIFSSNGKKQRPDYFGFSVGLVSNDDGTKWLVAGAPRSNISVYPDIIEPGMVYKCRVEVNSSNNECHHVFLGDMDFDRENHMVRQYRRHYGYAWTGATIDIIRNNDVVVCAPIWNKLTRGDYYVYGKCYILAKQLEDSRNIEISPLESYANNPRIHGHFYYRGQVGMSLHFVKDTGSLLLGGPGMDLWCGLVGEMKETFASSSGNKHINTSEYLGFSVPTQRDAVRKCNGDFGMFGYSVTSGRFSRTRTYIVGGAPKANNLLGMVLVYRQYRSNRYDIKKSITGFQTGEFFGASVVALDYDNNGIDDLVVGAPSHTLGNIREVGCIYVFLSKLGVVTWDKVKLHGDLKPGARFGTTLGSAIDLNNDHYQDILVGAPYEDNHGAVYVFNGQPYGINEIYSQKLYPRTSKGRTPLKGFGISFSRPTDIDSNQYPDIAIGSFLSDNAAIMFTRPVAFLFGNLSAKPSRIQALAATFQVTVCNWYELLGNREDAQKNIVINYTVQITGRTKKTEAVTFADNGNMTLHGNMSLSHRLPACSDINLNIMENHADFLEPITIELTNDILLTTYKDLVEIPVMDPRKSKTNGVSVPFITGCENDGDPTCKTNLNLNARFEEDMWNRGRITIGVKTVTLYFRVTNKLPGEPAYFPNITITVVQPVDFISFTHHCLRVLIGSKVTLSCQLENPIITEDDLRIDLDLRLLSEKSNDSAIVAKIASAANLDMNSESNMIFLPLSLTREASVEITGFDFHQEVFSPKNEVSANVTTQPIFNITHVTKITKTGLTPVAQIEIRFLIPESITVFGEERLPLLHLNKKQLHFNGKSQNCIPIKRAAPLTGYILSDLQERNLTNINCTADIFDCTEVACTVGPWNYDGETASLEIALQLNMTTLNQIVHMVNESFIMANVSAKIVSMDKSDYDTGQWSTSAAVKIYFVSTVTSVTSWQSPKLAWWKILLAVIVGNLLLIGLVAILHKCAFFERDKQLQMAALKENEIQMKDNKSNK